MSMHRSWAVAVTLASALCAVACSASSEGDGSPITEDGANNEVVGLADLHLMEKTFGLEPDSKVNGAWSRDVTKGRCHAAYGTREGVTFRRYKNGAAFFDALEQFNRERGNDRPVLCVDLDDSGFALDGVGLDAVFRFNLGKPVGTDSAPGGEVYLEFERGRMHVLVTDSVRGPSAGEVAALRGNHGSKLVESPAFLVGSLLDVTIDDAKVYEPFSGETQTHELQISGSLAAFAYAAAYAKTGNAFSLSRDPLGTLAGLTSGGDKSLRAEHGGDGPGWWQGLYFPVATISEAGFWEEGADPQNPDASRSIRTFRISGPSNPGEAYVDRADVECEMVTLHTSYEDQVGTPQPITCKGL